MGQEIEQVHFKRGDFQHFNQALQDETALLHALHHNRQLADNGFVMGFELEGWLLDQALQPAPLNQLFVEQFNSPLVTLELAKFNVELNTKPRPLTGNALSKAERELQQHWQKGQQIAQQINGGNLLAIGILPTVTPQHLSNVNMSEMQRYRALNEQVLRLRKGEPLKLDIQGHQHLKHSHHDLMLESAATSFQIHLQTPPALAVRHYNASKIVSAPLVAIAANSPFLFNHQLWDESRIPLFEQAVDVVAHPDSPHHAMRRVTFGHGYLTDSLVEAFQHNLDNYEVLLPLALSPSKQRLEHLALHNGTIWRWNRPLVGVDKQGNVHLRIEHRPLPAGPTIVDMIANAAFYFGLVSALADQLDAPEKWLPFAAAKRNFYQAAQHGLDADILWADGKQHPVQTLILEQLLPLAYQGLARLGIDNQDQQRLLGIIEQRTLNKQNGAAWQRQFSQKYQRDMVQLTAHYAERQQSNLPVHQWPL